MFSDWFDHSSKLLYYIETLFCNNKTENEVLHIAHFAQVVWGPVSYMFSKPGGRNKLDKRYIEVVLK